MVRKKFFIKRAKIKKGALSKQLGIKEEENIPFTLLDEILEAEAGEIITNPTQSGKKRIKVTSLLKKRSNLAKNLKRITQKRKR